MLVQIAWEFTRCLEPFRRHVDVTLLPRSACAGVKMGSPLLPRRSTATLATDDCGRPAMHPAASAARALAHGFTSRKTQANLCDKCPQLHSLFPTPLRSDPHP